MNPGCILLGIGFGLMLGGFYALEHEVPDPFKAVVACLVGMILSGMGIVVFGYVKENEKANPPSRFLNPDSNLLPKKKQRAYRGNLRVVVIVGPLVVFVILAVALSIYFNNGPMQLGRL